MAKKVVFLGCSFTAGTGWSESDPLVSVRDHPNLWVTLCHKNINYLADLELLNLGHSGASNSEIFENTIRAISHHGDSIDTVFCQWTSMPRYNFNVGFELWNTSESLHNIEARTHDVNLNNGTHYPRKYIVDLMNRLKVMHHLHWEILKVVDYTNIILRLTKLMGITNVFFINGICPWDKNYFIELENVTPDKFTNFTKTDILNINTRDDKDIYQLYHLAHKQYRDAGGINTAHWINLYKSFFDQQVDTNFNNLHPGTQSNNLYYQAVKSHLHNKL